MPPPVLSFARLGPLRSQDLEQQDPELFCHGLRVGRIAVRIGVEMEFPTERRLLLSRAGELHDLGKLAVPAALVRKRGPLTLSETAVLRRHPAIGAALLKEDQEPAELVEAVLYHHERWDGTGYPSGLQGSDIPLAARILTLADAFDAMISSRPYCSPQAPLWAVEEILRNRERQFCPECVEAFLESEVPSWTEHAV